MKMRFASVAVCLLLLTAIGVPAYAGTVPGTPSGGEGFTLWFDEYGNGWVDVGPTGHRVPDPGFLAIDPLSGMLALAYALPEQVVPGDVTVQEFNQTRVLSDGLRFEDDLFGFGAVMFYFSDPGDSALADTGFPSGFSCGRGCDITETGIPEVHDGFDYSGFGVIYHGTSDAPEPSSLLLLGSGLLGAIGVARQRFLS